MAARILERMKALEPKQTAVLALAPGVLAVALDVAIAHFAGREMVNPAQLLPVTVAPAAAIVLLVGAAKRGWLTRAMRIGGAALAVLGTVGTGFHLRALLRLLTGAGEKLTWQGLQAALAVAPPLFAPGAFLGLGVVVLLLASPRVEVGLRSEQPLRPARLAAVPQGQPARAA